MIDDRTIAEHDKPLKIIKEVSGQPISTTKVRQSLMSDSRLDFTALIHKLDVKRPLNEQERL